MFSLNLKAIREDRRLSQRELAKILGMSQGSVGNWESGAREPDFETTKKIAEYFGVSTDFLLGNTGDSTPPQKEKALVLDDEALDVMEQMHKRPELRVLFSTSIKAKKEDIEAVDKLLKHMAGEDKDYDD